MKRREPPFPFQFEPGSYFPWKLPTSIRSAAVVKILGEVWTKCTAMRTPSPFPLLLSLLSKIEARSGCNTTWPPFSLSTKSFSFSFPLLLSSFLSSLFSSTTVLLLLLLLHLLLLLPRDFAINLPYVASFTNWRRYFQVSIDRCTIILSTPDNCNGSEASEMSLHVYT